MYEKTKHLKDKTFIELLKMTINVHICGKIVN